MGSFIFRLENRQKRKIGTEVSFLLFPHDCLFLALFLYSDILSPFLFKNVLCSTRCNRPHKKYYQKIHSPKGSNQSLVKICDVSMGWGGRERRKRNSSVDPIDVITVPVTSQKKMMTVTMNFLIHRPSGLFISLRIWISRWG